jgi:hypothetical protein
MIHNFRLIAVIESQLLKHTVCIVKYLGRLEIEHLLQLYLSFELSGWPKKQYRKAAALIPVRLSDWLGHFYGIQTCCAYSLR